MTKKGYLDNLDDIVYYLYLNEKYIDFRTLMFLTDTPKTYLWRMLEKIDVSYIEYFNRKLYKLSEITSSVELMEILDVDRLFFD
jgi:hypothetical protein